MMRSRAGKQPGVADTLDAGELSRMSSAKFVRRCLPVWEARKSVRAIDFIGGRSHSEAIEAAIAAVAGENAQGTVTLDSQDWVVERAIRMSSNLELLIDGCRLKLADRVHDNIIRSAGIRPNPADPFGVCLSINPVDNIRITGRNGAVIEGADNPYAAVNPKTGMVEKWLGDYFGWRTVGIQLSRVSRYEISGLTMRKTHCWAISQELCSYGYLHDIVFDTDVKNGDGIDFRNGCSFCVVDTITGTTSDDTVACTALNGSYLTPESKYIYPMQPMGCVFPGDTADIHDILIRNIRTGGKHHEVICLATSPRVYNITMENIIEDAPSEHEAAIKIYTGYGSGFKKGNLSNISVSNVVAKGARYAVMVKADVRDVSFSGVRQLNPDCGTHSFVGDSDNLVIEAI